MTRRAGADGRGERGFTFIEVMIALFFLSYIVGQMALISMHSSRSSAYAQRLTRANMIAEAVLEGCRTTAFDKLATEWCIDTNANANCDAGEPKEAKTVAGAVASLTWNYDVANGNPIPSFYTRTRTVQYQTTGVASTSYTADVTVTVGWIDARGAAQQVRVASIVSKF